MKITTEEEQKHFEDLVRAAEASVKTEAGVTEQEEPHLDELEGDFPPSTLAPLALPLESVTADLFVREIQGVQLFLWLHGTLEQLLDLDIMTGEETEVLKQVMESFIDHHNGLVARVNYRRGLIEKIREMYAGRNPEGTSAESKERNPVPAPEAHAGSGGGSPLTPDEALETNP